MITNEGRVRLEHTGAPELSIGRPRPLQMSEINPLTSCRSIDK